MNQIPQIPHQNRWVIELVFLRMYFDTGEAAFRTSKAQHKEKVERVLKHVVDIETQEQRDREVQRLQQRVFTPHFRFLRYSQVFLVCAIGELLLRGFCEDIHSQLSLSTTIDEVKAKSFILKVQQYQEDEANLSKLPNQDWDNLRFVWALRNCVAHGNGELQKTKSRDKNIIENNINKWAGIAINGGSLQIEQEFLEQVLTRLTSFFGNLFSSSSGLQARS